MLVVAIVITVLGILSVVYIRYEEIKFQKRQNSYIRELEIINKAHYEFVDFIVSTLSNDSVDQALRYKILKYLLEDKIDLNPDGGR